MLKGKKEKRGGFLCLPDFCFLPTTTNLQAYFHAGKFVKGIGRVDDEPRITNAQYIPKAEVIIRYWFTRSIINGTVIKTIIF